METSKLSDNFLLELFKCCFFKKDVFETTLQHLKYNYIPNELKAYKKVLKTFDTYYNSHQKIPSIGIVAQSCNDKEVDEVLAKINKIKTIPETTEIFESLTTYIQRVKFQELHLKLVELYNNDKPEQAIKLQAEESQKIVNFSVHQNTNYFEEVFGGFSDRNHRRFIEKNSGKEVIHKIPFGIDYLDVKSRGGANKSEGDTTLMLARSGSGKTKYLRWLGVSAARRGYKVLHIQAEGTKEETMTGYDATWTGVLKSDFTEMDSKLEQKLKRIINDIKNKGGQISVFAFEQFGTADMLSVRQKVLDYHKLNGFFPDVLILDYLTLFDPGDGKKYPATFEGEKMRIENSARKFRNICNEMKMIGHSAAQVDNISPADYNNSAFVITRNNTSLAKGLAESFSFVFSHNVTNEEYKNNCARIHADKLRQYKGSFTFPICTNFDRDRYFDRIRTLDLFAEIYNK